MKKLTFKPTGVCCKEMQITLTDNNLVEDVVFVGGCPGNTLGISALVKGQRVEDVISKLKGIKCGFKDTSCPDQLTKALELL